MSKLCILIVIIVLMIPNVQSWSGNYCSVQVCGWRDELRCAYTTWTGACCAWKWVKVSYYYTSYFCCNGWKTSSYENCDVAICSPGCVNGGTCVSPNTCSCPSPYIGPICNGVAACSYLKPCYPGVCSGSDICWCTNGFNGTNCMNFQDETFKPAINRCNATFTFFHYMKNMAIYKYFGDASNSVKPFVLWTNQADFNLLEMTMEAIYDTKYNIQQPVPTLPAYVKSFKLGIVSAGVKASLYKVSGTATYNQTYQCSEPSNDNPIRDSLLVCTLNATNDIRVDSGDRFVLNFIATSGGFIEYIPNTGRRYYTGKSTQNSIEFKFDHEEPIHCITSTPSCADKPLHVQEDITKKSIKPSWGGWNDSLSGIEKYSLELWEMEFSKDDLNLREPLITDTINPVPVFIQEFNNTGSIQYPEIAPNKSGVYSIILEVSDKANNTRYARRFVIYDPTSTITIQDNPLFCSTASSAKNYLWQTDINNDNGRTRISITWTDHFINRVHQDGHFLSSIGKYQPRLTDGRRRVDYKRIDEIFDDNEGTRNKNAIPNVNGIVKFDVAYQAPPADLSNLVWTELNNLNQSFSLILATIVDGSARQFFVRATDIMGNQKINSTTVYFDSTRPEIYTPQLEYNVKNSIYDFASRFTIDTSDSHSGVPIIALQIVTKSGVIKKNHTYRNPSVGTSCHTSPCYCIPNGECYKSEMTFDVNNCWMQVAINEINTEIHILEISAYNGAGLSEKKTVNIADVKNLTGIQNYFGVENIQIESKSDTGFRVTWIQPKSCYERIGILLMLTDLNRNLTKQYTIFKDATEYYVGSLNPSSSYSFQIFTKYGTDNNFQMSAPVSMSLVTADKQTSGLEAGGIAGIVVGFCILIIIFVILLIYLHRTGRLKKTEERVASTFTHIRQTIKRDNGFINRSYSGDHDNDIYFYGGMQFQPESALSRQSISFDSELCRGKFAIIYKAVHYKQNKEAETVAAKTLKDSFNEVDIMQMRAKINFYETKVGHHRNILNFIGAVEDDTRGPFMVLEYCENGSVKDYLNSKKSLVNDDMQERLFRFSFGICMGMDYLAENGIVHRRLAARNVLLDFLLEPKITGFGPDPSLNDDSSDKSEKIPVKWMAPECMTSTKKANERSDVWSYGIVLWEIFSIGETPYADVRSQDLPGYLKQNRRMAKPEYCDDSFYKMMKKCWQYEPGKRPNFKKLKNELSTMFTESAGDEYYYRRSAIYDNTHK